MTGTTVRRAAARAKEGMEEILPIYSAGGEGIDAATVSLVNAYEVIKVVLEARDGAVPEDLIAVLHYDASAAGRMVVSVEFRRLGDPSFTSRPCAAVSLAVCKLSGASERQALDVVAPALNAEVAQLRALGVPSFASGDLGGMWKYVTVCVVVCWLDHHAQLNERLLARGVAAHEGGKVAGDANVGERDAKQRRELVGVDAVLKQHGVRVGRNEAAARRRHNEGCEATAHDIERRLAAKPDEK